MHVLDMCCIACGRELIQEQRTYIGAFSFLSILDFPRTQNAWLPKNVATYAVSWETSVIIG